MSDFSGRTLLLSAACAAAIFVPLSVDAERQYTSADPIAFTAHGGVFDRSRHQLMPTLTLIRDAQAWYRSYLLAHLSKERLTQFDATQRKLLAGLKLDPQSRLIADAYLVDWLSRAVQSNQAREIRAKNDVLRLYLAMHLPQASTAKARFDLIRFEINPELVRRLWEAKRSEPRFPPQIFIVTQNGGAAYRAECAANGVPLPPDIGDPNWVSQGQIPQSELFIVAALHAEVMTFHSTSPEGMCVALPRFDNSNTVQLDGIICLGKVSSKVCFWDNEINAVTHTFTRGASVPINGNFGGGTEIDDATSGVCSDCHAGENPYIIHGAVLNGLASSGLPTFPDNWYDPIVKSGWPQNPGPMNSPPDCRGCHGMANAKGFAGRFPHASNALQGWCNAVLANSISKTMPPGAPGSLAGTPEMVALQSWCSQPPDNNASGRGDPHIITYNDIHYDFQAAGEFTALRGDSGTELQTRHTPVSTAVLPVANAYTGLASCVSLTTAFAARVGTHRATYQPKPLSRGEPGDLQLRIDGALTSVGSAGINLTGGGRIVRTADGSGIEIFFPDQTHVIVTSNFWVAHSLWYLNVDVVHTPARDGLFGAVLGGNWLPLLPNGTGLGPKPASLHQRYVQLNQTFANAWRVTNGTSLFDYGAGESTGTYTVTGWPPENVNTCIVPASKLPPTKPLDRKVAETVCRRVTDKGMNVQCVFDVTYMGEKSFADGYYRLQKLVALTPKNVRR